MEKGVSANEYQSDNVIGLEAEDWAEPSTVGCTPEYDWRLVIFFRLKDAMSKQFSEYGRSPLFGQILEPVLSIWDIKARVLVWKRRWERRKAAWVFKSCLRGHWPLPGGARWVGKRQGGGRSWPGWRWRFPHHTHTLAMNRAGRRKWLACGRACIIRIREGAVNTAAHVPV